MAQTFDRSEKENKKHTVWQSVKEFFEEEERPLSPELVAGLTQLPKGTFYSPRPSTDERDPNAERVHRRTQQKTISESHSTIWPG